MDFIVDFLIDYYGPIPYLAIFLILLACGIGIPIPEDITLIAGGILTYYGVCDIRIMMVVGLFGVIIGDSFMFWLGHHYGRRLAKKWPFRMFIDEQKIESIRRKLKNHGGKLLFSARFMPGLRSTVFFATGMLHFPYRKLLVYDGLAAFISVPTIIFSVYYFGDYIEHVIRMIKKVEGGIFGVILLVVLLVALKYYLKKKRMREKSPNEI